MKTFRIALTKSWLIKINAETETEARHCAEFFTDNIGDISDETDRAEYNFNIKEIECTVNEEFEAEELDE